MENSNHLGSQIQGSMRSTLLSYEPPNVGNWFGSYEYESPVLGTIDGCRDSFSGKGEVFVIQENTKQKENQMGELKKTRYKEETNSNLFANMQENQSLNEIQDSSHLPSPSHVSEPLDIRNWFSSYVYESFVLDTNDDVKDTISQESECGAERFVVGERHIEQEENMAAFREIGTCSEMDSGQEICSNGLVKSDSSLRDDEPDDMSLKSSSKILESPDSTPTFTEPPDVKNWLSSYAYDSPELGTSDRFEDSHHIEKKSDKFVVEDDDGEKEEKLVIIRKVRSSDERVDKQGKVSKSIDGIGRKESLSPQNNLCSIKIFKESLEGRAVKSNDTSPSKEVKESSFNDEVSISKQKQEFSQDACSASLNPNRISSSNSKKSPTRTFHRTAFIKETMKDVNLVSPSRNNKLAIISRASPIKQTHGSNDKENGLVATRKNPSTRTEYEDYSKRPLGIVLECATNKGTFVSPTGEKNGVIRRKVLSETTNYQNSDVLEVTGKWRCPQRSKQNRGPPLKQLRLEQWIHRV